MDIKKFVITLFFLMILMNLVLFSTMSNSSVINEENPAQVQSITDPKKSDELPLTDKVYNFTAPNDRLSFDNYFDKHYMYNIHIELVTPHACTMNITLLDHDDKLFDIFDAPMFYTPEFGRCYDIPFGTVDSGLFTLTFETSSTLNFNLHILIEKEVKCLYDKMDPKYTSDEALEFYDVERFYNGRDISEPIHLETDEMYKFYIGRVSAITIAESADIRVDYTITCPDGLLYVIYSNNILAGVDGISSFDFGTALEGTYTLQITIHIMDVQDIEEPEWVNVAYAVSDDYTIGDAEDVNTTKSDVKDSKSDDPDILDELESNILLLPGEMLIGTLLVIGGVSAAMVILLIRNRKTNLVSASLKPK